jgi:hypothetical protein
MNVKPNIPVSPNRASANSKIPRIIPKPPKDEEEKVSLKKLKIKIKK